MNHIIFEYNSGMELRNLNCFDYAIMHFTRALNIFHYNVGSQSDVIFWSRILLSRAEVYLRCQQFNRMIEDIKLAIKDCPQQDDDMVEMELWRNHASNIRSPLSIWCYTAALHFAAGVSKLEQSKIHCDRAWEYYENSQLSEWENDIKVSKTLDYRPAIRYGSNNLDQAMGLLAERKCMKAIDCLEISELLLRPLNPSVYFDKAAKKKWNDSMKLLIETLWDSNMYHKAIQVGKKCKQLESCFIQEKAELWKDKGNKMFSMQKYNLAIECYAMSIQYTASENNAVFLGKVYSNRSQSYLKTKQFVKAKDDAKKCLEYRPDWSKGYYRLGTAFEAMKNYERALDSLRKGLNVTCNEENDTKYEIVQKILNLVYKCPDGISKISFEIPRDCMSKYLTECAEKSYWKSLEMFLLGGGGQYAKGDGGIATGKCDLNEISLCDVIKSDPKPSMFYKLIETLIEHGALVNTSFHHESPLTAAVNFEDHDLAVILLKKNAEPGGLLRSKFAGKNDNSHVHIAFKIGLLKGHWKMFDYLMEVTTADSTSSEMHVDRRGNSLYHLVASENRTWPYVEEGIKILRKHKVDPNTKNKDGKTPLMMINRDDLRYRIIEERMNECKPEKSKKKKKRKKKNNNQMKNPIVEEPCKKDKGIESNKDEEVDNVSIESCIHSPSEIELLRVKLEKDIDKFVIATKESLASKKSNDVIKKEKNPPIQNKEMKPSDNDKIIKNCESKSPLPSQSVDQAVDKVNDECTDDVADTVFCDDDDDDDDDDDVTNMAFDNSTWEVECTSDVWKKLNDKKLPRDKKKRIVNIVKQLALGNMRRSLAKQLAGIAKRSNIRLFEAKIDKSARILWERAIAFSPRCSALPENKNDISRGIYTEIIRIWDIVFDHDTVPRKIEKIVRSYDRGASCFLKKKLKGTDNTTSESSSDIDERLIPKIYVPKDDGLGIIQHNDQSQQNASSKKESTSIFFPRGSSEETEYHSLKLYAFSNAMINAMLDQRQKTNFDFPFRVSELEHSIISLATKPPTSILLLGRSGTGKTTCCLYRLWNNYQSYWKNHTLSEPTIPNASLFVPRDEKESFTENADDQTETTCEVFSQKKFSRSSFIADDTTNVKEGPVNVNNQIPCSIDVGECLEKNSDAVEQKFDHLHQVFITKNAVSCKNVQKNFIDLSRATFSSRDDLQYEPSLNANRLDQLENNSWPLFICSRDWLLMLDASLPGVQFFPRNEDGTIERPVEGWGEEDNNLQGMPIYQSDDDEEDEEEGDKETEQRLKTMGDEEKAFKRDPRREITYEVFKNNVWRKITKKNKVDFHPSLVWTEIISFIKGSVEALHSDEGYLSLVEYQSIGNKRAQTFNADREIIYELFKAYQRIQQNEGMFDEADVVHHIFQRLKNHIPTWSIHEIYVDETQDFTQAELSVIISSCRNPNALFFTGDTAQSIMRGIAFRFSDLRSLFYYLRESVKSVGQDAEVVVPDRVYELTNNYRSHSGILNLASSVTDLLSYFFPESFDKLARDQGLFEGPKPVLLESCSFSDLAVILRGHKRKSSPIEFGAHQVILVVSNEVRESLPDELSLALVMTIYEAKGLEFDDVLLYNFFKDSQACKEWRVVGSYKESKDDVTKVSETGIAELPVESLKLKARPLEFNPDQHKILISEFKYLYTALTRARVNVWIFDENEERRSPMFEYFQKRDVVEVKHFHKAEDDSSSLQGMFAQKSNPKEWMERGIYFYKNGRWKAASKCFSMAGEDIWVKKCAAHQSADEAATLQSKPRLLRIEFAKAALLFLECGMSNEAEKCLYNARQWILLAKLFEKSKHFLKAATIFQKERKFNDAARNYESAGDFQTAADSLLSADRYNEALNLIARYKDLLKKEEQGVITKHLRPDQRDESICYRAAKFYQRRGNKKLMKDALEKLPNVNDRITFLKNNGFFEEAAELLLHEGKRQEAAKLLRSKGKFLEAVRLSDDMRFIAECYLIEARLKIHSAKQDQESINEYLSRAVEICKKEEDFSLQAEVLFTQGEFCENAQDIADAGQYFLNASNYVGLVDCFNLLLKYNPTRIDNRKAGRTITSLLDLILAFHKRNINSRDRAMITQCYAYFGIKDSDDAAYKKVPRLEMVRFIKLSEEELIPTAKADGLIKDHLHKMASSLVEQCKIKQEEIFKKNKPCPRFLDCCPCDMSSCVHLHEKITRKHFTNQLSALRFLIDLEQKLSDFLNNMKRESHKSLPQLRSLLFTFPEFSAGERLYEILFPFDNQIPSSFFLSENDVAIIRRLNRTYLINFAKNYLWKKAKTHERWSSSDLFIKVSNILHLAGAQDGDIYNLLAVEEKKFEENARCNSEVKFPGMFRNRYGGYDIFLKSFDICKKKLYRDGDVPGSVHTAIKKFLFTPAKNRKLPYPSIANAVAILERQLTTCLVLFSCVAYPKESVCLPESYVSMINFWDYTECRRNETKTFRFFDAISHSTKQFLGVAGLRSLAHLHELLRSIVQLTFGEVSWSYNIVYDTLCKNDANFVDAERVLVLVLTMLCNCGLAIPRECDKIIRFNFLSLQFREGLPEKLKCCLESVRKAVTLKDIVLCLDSLLVQKPYEDKLLDVVWDVHKGKIHRMNCHFDRYEIWDLVKIDESQLKTREERKDHMEEDIYDDAFGEDAEASRNDPSQVKRKQHSNEELNDAAIVLQRAIKRWMSREALTEKQEVENDPVKFHFQKFKLGKSSCTICRPVEFVDLSSTIKSSEELQIEDKEQGWTPRLLKRNTFNTHCGRKSPHWKIEKSFVNYVEFYRRQVYPIKSKAETLIGNMGNLGDKYYLDLDRLKDLMNQLNEKMKKVENDRRWDSISLVKKAAEEVDKATRRINGMTKRRGSLNPSERGLEEEFKDVFEEDEQLVGQLKPVHNIKAKNKYVEKKKMNSRSHFS